MAVDPTYPAAVAGPGASIAARGRARGRAGPDARGAGGGGAGRHATEGAGRMLIRDLPFF